MPWKFGKSARPLGMTTWRPEKTDSCAGSVHSTIFRKPTGELRCCNLQVLLKTLGATQSLLRSTAPSRICPSTGFGCPPSPRRLPVKARPVDEVPPGSFGGPTSPCHLAVPSGRQLSSSAVSSAPRCGKKADIASWSKMMRVG